MKLTNGEIFSASQALGELNEKEFPIRVNYGLLSIIKKLSGQFEIIDKLRVDLIKKYGTADEVGNITIEPNTESWTKFITDLNILFNEDVEIDYEVVKLPFEVDGKSYNISMKTLRILEKFIEMV